MLFVRCQKYFKEKELERFSHFILMIEFLVSLGTKYKDYVHQYCEDLGNSCKVSPYLCHNMNERIKPSL